MKTFLVSMLVESDSAEFVRLTPPVYEGAELIEVVEAEILEAIDPETDSRVRVIKIPHDAIIVKAKK